MNCHPAYGTKKELYDLSVAASKREPEVFRPLGGFRDDFYGSVAKDSAEYGVRILPPDFTFNQVRSVRDGEDPVKELFRIISFGVYPIMPAWQGALEDKDIWSDQHYVRSLIAHARRRPRRRWPDADQRSSPPRRPSRCPRPRSRSPPSSRRPSTRRKTRRRSTTRRATPRRRRGSSAHAEREPA